MTKKTTCNFSEIELFPSCSILLILLRTKMLQKQQIQLGKHGNKKKMKQTTLLIDEKEFVYIFSSSALPYKAFKAQDHAPKTCLTRQKDYNCDIKIFTRKRNFSLDSNSKSL